MMTKVKNEMKDKILFIIAIVLLWAGSLQAQTKKEVTVSDKVPYVDQLAIKEDDNDMQLTLKILFDEDDNTLTVTLTSPKNLFVFWDDLRLKQVFSSCRWLQTEKLPYEVSCNTSDKFQLSKSYYKTLPCCRRKYNFAKWIEVEGAQPVAHELKLVNDSIVQVYTLQDKQAKAVTLLLRHVLAMDETDHKGSGHWYNITYGKDFNQKYHVNLQRNPCLGLDDDVASAEGSLEAVRYSLDWFGKKYASGKVADKESLNDFEALKQTLVEQFPKSTVVSPCPTVQQARDQYNVVVDSLQLINVTLDTVATGGNGTAADHAIIANNVLSYARMLDNAVARWLVSKDETERDDLIDQCRSIIKDTHLLLSENPPLTSEEKHAVFVFRKAEQYYKKVCK